LCVRYIYHGFYKQGGAIQTVDVSGVLDLQISDLWRRRSSLVDDDETKGGRTAGVTVKDYEEKLLNDGYGHDGSDNPLSTTDVGSSVVDDRKEQVTSK
jgi:hypothetical protein